MLYTPEVELNYNILRIQKTYAWESLNIMKRSFETGFQLLNKIQKVYVERNKF